MSNRIAKRAYWSEQNKHWESSGLSQKKFCEQQGLNYRQFVHWRRLINKSMVRKPEPKLLKVTTTSTSTVNPAPRASESTLEVVLPTGIKLFIKTESDLRKASALIHLLGAAR